ncbi:TM109 protein, partial [Mionectes macconnelli]|nr:TM109 protein [Mionectes macconnelli]
TMGGGLSRLGKASWDTLEGWVGPQALQMVAESLSTTLWIISSGISAALTTLCRILADLLAAFGIGGELGSPPGMTPAPIPGATSDSRLPFPGHRLVRAAALSPGEVQGGVLWALAALVGSWVLSRLRGGLLPLLRGVKLFLFLGAFLHVAASKESPTVQAGMLLALGGVYTLLGSLVGSQNPTARLGGAVRSLEWKVEELRRRQK